MRVAGGDAALPAWIRRGITPPEAPTYDSVVIRGGGVGAATLAGRLGRAACFRDRVVVAAPRSEESPRLVGGCTLRARSVDYYAAALGTTVDTVLDAVYGQARPITTVQHAAWCVDEGGGDYRVARSGIWMDGRAHPERPLSYGVRNGRLIAALTELAEERGSIRTHPEQPATLDDARALAPGSKPLIVNVSPAPIGGAPKGLAPTGWVAAAQITFTDAERRGRGVLEDGGSCVAVVGRDGWLDVGVYYPFADRLTPDATYYGIFYRVLPRSADPKDDAPTRELHETVVGVGRARGRTPQSAGATLGTAIVPAMPWRDAKRHAPGCLDLSGIYNAVTPIITGCGMARAGLASFVAGEAIVAGEDPIIATNRALWRWRISNRAFAAGMTFLSGPAGRVISRWPGAFVRQMTRIPDMWAGIDMEDARA